MHVNIGLVDMCINEGDVVNCRNLYKELVEGQTKKCEFAVHAVF